MMLAVEFADFGFGTVVGAIVTGSILIFLDHRRRSDEKKNRFLAEKRLAYRSIAQVLDVIDEQISRGQSNRVMPNFAFVHLRRLRGHTPWPPP